MSMTSKVSPTLRQEIIKYLTGNPNSTNTNLYFGLDSFPSQRKIQEATQKMTKDGTLVRTGNRFSVAPATGTASARLLRASLACNISSSIVGPVISTQ
jgi:hypothetical protein